MIETRFAPTDIPGVYANVGVHMTPGHTEWWVIVLVFAVAWAFTWAWLMVTARIGAHD